MCKKSMLFGLNFTLIFLFFIVLLSCTNKSKPETPEVKKPTEAVVVTSEKTGWEAEWEKVVKGAVKEGTVVVYGAPIPKTRLGFTESFQKAYPGIKLEYTGMPGSLGISKVKAERRAGLYVVDVYIGGTITIIGSDNLRPFVTSIRPFLIHPEAKDPKAWMGGKLDFSDDAEEINLVFTLNVSSRVAYNTDIVDAREIASFRDLVNPKWSGKIIMWDPRVVGSGNATATFWYLNEQLGLDYIRAFASNKPVFTRDLRFQVESLAQGKYSIAIAPDPTTVIEFQQAGTHIKFADFMKEGTYSSAAFGSVAIMDKAPHPNAATLFLNWLLSKEGQTVWTLTSGYASRRIDAPTEHLIESEKPKPGAYYVPTYKEKYIAMKEEISDQVNKIFGAY